MSSGVHNASAAAAGYLYQVRWALLNLLRNAPTRPDLIISLEMHDDVAWEDVSGQATELLQTKLHAKSTAGLSDTHADIWKTLLIWLKRTDATDPHGPDLALVTTSSAPSGTAAFALRPGPARDVAEAVRLLSIASTSSKAKATREGRARFLALSAAERTVLLSRVQVLDAALPLEDLDEAVRGALVLGLPSGTKAQVRFVAELWRWWDTMTIEMLSGQRPGVPVGQLLAFVQDLRNGYGPESLPGTVQRDDVTDADIEGVQDERFVHQMRLVRYPMANLRRAVVDYHRALKQETQWLDDDLLALPELRTFEENLRDEWQRAFTDMLDDLGGGLEEYDPASVDDAFKVRAGKQLLRSLLDSTVVSVRRQYTDPFFARGKRHELANRDLTSSSSTADGAGGAGTGNGIGWHPDFVERLTRVVASA